MAVVKFWFPIAIKTRTRPGGGRGRLARAVLTLLPVLLHYFGTRWRPGVALSHRAA